MEKVRESFFLCKTTVYVKACDSSQKGQNVENVLALDLVWARVGNASEFGSDFNILAEIMTA